MNIVTPIPTTLAVPTANINTEAARRDNLLRETIPQTTEGQQGASKNGLGAERDRARQPGQAPAPVTYERPQIAAGLAQVSQRADEGSTDKDNASDESAGKQDAEQKQQQAQQREVEQLKSRDREVRTHEQAHAAVGGQYAGAPRYEYTQGPDGKRYATSGEVSIDISEAKTPEQTIKKMQQVRAAALAPAEPSSQDLKVAAEASRKAQEARAEVAQQGLSETKASSSSAVQTPQAADDTEQASSIPLTRSLEEAFGGANTRDNRVANSERRALAFNDVMQSRIEVIDSFYQSVTTPVSAGFSASA